MIVASLLPSLFSLEDPSPDLKLIHNCCSSLARTLLATGDSSGSWQHCVDLAHFGLHPVQHGNPASQLVSLVLLQRKQWGLLVEVSVGREGERREEGGGRVLLGSFSCKVTIDWQLSCADMGSSPPVLICWHTATTSPLPWLWCSAVLMSGVSHPLSCHHVYPPALLQGDTEGQCILCWPLLAEQILETTSAEVWQSEGVHIMNPLLSYPLL